VNSEMELEIGAGHGAGNYVVRVIRAPTGGEPSGSLMLDVEGLIGRRPELETAVLASGVPRRSVSLAERPVRELGRLLFEALFTGPVYGTYRASLGAVQQQGKRLRLVLRLAAPELAALPWEMLFDPETGTYLCRQEPLVRHVAAPYTPDPLEVRLPLRMLGLIASPRGLPPLEVDEEMDRLERALTGPIANGLVELAWVHQATWAGVHAHLLAAEWHILHFVGHGDYDAIADEGVIALVGPDGRADLVEANRFADLLGEAQPIPRLVVLNSCSSGRSGGQDIFSGTAAALARSGISSVAAMQFAVSDTAAIAFARGLYTAIAHGRDVAQAARSGRISILGIPHSLEWVTPVLYLRGQATQLFALNTQPGLSDQTRTGDQTIAEVRSTFEPDTDQQSAMQAAKQRSRQAQEKHEKQARARDERRLAIESGTAEAELKSDAIKRQLKALERLLQDRNRNLTRGRRHVEAIFNARGAEAFVAVLQEALATSHYPYGMQGSFAAAYRPEVHELLIEYELPGANVIPTVESYRYIRTRGILDARPRSEAQRKDLYAKLIARITLRTLAEAFDAAPETLVNAIVLNGYVSAVDATSGRPIRPLLISTSATRETFAEIMLDGPELDPLACLRHYLNAAVSPRPDDLEAIRPVARFDLSKYKFVEEMDVVARLGSHPDLLKLTPVEFEHLIRQLFEAIGMKSWVTQASMDEGVDVVAVNDDPIVGGLYIIQVKRYTKAVGLETAQTLAGVLQYKKANKGILITTSWVSKTARDFAERHPGIEIIDGLGLKSMLRRHLGIDVVINLPKIPPH
jgi:Restriction endonuclease/CHAT domain